MRHSLFTDLFRHDELFFEEWISAVLCFDTVSLSSIYFQKIAVSFVKPFGDLFLSELCIHSLCITFVHGSRRRMDTRGAKALLESIVQSEIKITDLIRVKYFCMNCYPVFSRESVKTREFR